VGKVKKGGTILAEKSSTAEGYPIVIAAIGRVDIEK
jgi:hypothetical protein